MPMIQRRKKVVKKKRRCLFGAERIKLNEPNENTINIEQPVKKNKSGLIIDIKLEKKTAEETSLKELKELKPKSKINKTIEVIEFDNFTHKESVEEISKEILSPQIKTKQRYIFLKCNIIFVYH